MSRALLLILIVFSLLFTGLAGLRPQVLALALPFLLYLLYGLWRGPGSIRLEAVRTLSAERAAPGSAVKVTVRVTNRGGDLEELALADVLAPGLLVENGSCTHLISLRRGQSFDFEYSLSGRRGSYALETLQVEAGDHLGLVRVLQRLRTPGRLFIFPTVTRLKSIPIRPRRTRIYAGTIPARVGGPGIEFFGVRDYQAGDPPRHINWHASARHAGELYSNEFQQERVADVGLVLDGRERSNSFAGGQSIFEHSVLAVAALADAFIEQGNRVGLLVFSREIHWVFPGYGKLQRERILHALSQAVTGAGQHFEGLEFLPTRMFPPESQIALVSPLMEQDYAPLIGLRARGYKVLVVNPDPVAFEHRHLPPRPEIDAALRVVRLERELLIRRLERAGVQVAVWDVGRPFDQSMRRSFGRAAQMEARR